MLLIALSLMTVLSVDAKNKVRVIAHRGYWNTENSARNSVSALNNAIEIKAYGAEFDVNMTADGVLLVHHDAKTTNGILIEESTFADLRAKAPKLDNGELIPTLDDYLTSWNHAKKTKLICEIKGHSTPEIETRVVEAVLAKLQGVEATVPDGCRASVVDRGGYARTDVGRRHGWIRSALYGSAQEPSVGRVRQRAQDDRECLDGEYGGCDA